MLCKPITKVDVKKTLLLSKLGLRANFNVILSLELSIKLLCFCTKLFVDEKITLAGQRIFLNYKLTYTMCLFHIQLHKNSYPFRREKQKHFL